MLPTKWPQIGAPSKPSESPALFSPVPSCLFPLSIIHASPSFQNIHSSSEPRHLLNAELIQESILDLTGFCDNLLCDPIRETAHRKPVTLTPPTLNPRLSLRHTDQRYGRMIAIRLFHASNVLLCLSQLGWPPASPESYAINGFPGHRLLNPGDCKYL